MRGTSCRWSAGFSIMDCSGKGRIWRGVDIGPGTTVVLRSVSMVLLGTLMVLVAGCATTAYDHIPSRAEMTSKTCSQLRAEYQAIARYEKRRGAPVQVSAPGGVAAPRTEYPSIGPLVEAWGPPDVSPALNQVLWEFGDKCVEASTAGGRVIRFRLSDRVGAPISRAASSPRTAPQVAPTERAAVKEQQPESADDMVRRLKDLKSLYDAGILTDQEYETRRKAIVERL